MALRVNFLQIQICTCWKNYVFKLNKGWPPVIHFPVMLTAQVYMYETRIQFFGEKNEWGRGAKRR